MEPSRIADGQYLPPRNSHLGLHSGSPNGRRTDVLQKGVSVIESQDLAKLKIRRIIFHDVPQNLKGGTAKPELADAETQIDPPREQILKDRLTGALSSNAAYPVESVGSAASIVQDEIDKYLAKHHTSAQFIQMSRRLAEHLFTQQSGATSPGLLCVIDLTSDGRAALALLKLERERGAELEWQTLTGGKRAIQMSVLDNLVLTEGTRLFKSALFIRQSKTEIIAKACDSQSLSSSSIDLAQFWLRFLGCMLVEEPRISTQRWFDATVQYLNENVTDPVQKSELYGHLVSELNSNKSMVSPKKFASDFVSIAESDDYLAYLKAKNVGSHQFRKDTADIATKLQRLAFYTSKGVMISAPADQENLVGIEAEQIIVHDHLQRVVKK
jgi:hypothetical protein